MNHLIIEIGKRLALIEAPENLIEALAIIFPSSRSKRDDDIASGHISLSSAGEYSWTFSVNGGLIQGPYSQADILEELAGSLWAIAGDCSDENAFALDISAVSWGESAIIVDGFMGSGKSFLVAWLIEKGFACVSDGMTVLSGSGKEIFGLIRPIAVTSISAGKLARLPSFTDRPTLKIGSRNHFVPDASWISPVSTVEPALIILVEHRPEATLSILPLTPEMLIDRLTRIHPRASEHIAKIARTPALSLIYPSFSSIDDVLDQLAIYAAEVRPEPKVFERFLAKISPSNTKVIEKTFEVPEPTDRSISAKLTIGMATYDDYDGVYFTLQAIRMYHPEVLAQVEFLVVDNHPDGPCSAALKRLENHIPNYRYIPARDVNGTAIRDLVFKWASGEYVLCTDCHVLFAPGSISKLLDYFADHPETVDLIQGPIIWDDLQGFATHFIPEWRAGMYGHWGRNDDGENPEGPAFDIPMQGLGVFACRKIAWLGFNPLFRGFGGEEGYIHKKFQNIGARTLCLPSLRWLHRFERPFGQRYRNVWEDRFRNYLIGWAEIDLPLEPLKDHIVEVIGDEKARRLISKVEMEISQINSVGLRRD